MKNFILLLGVLVGGFSAQAADTMPQSALPTFEDFRQVDRARRMAGQLETAELLKVTQIDRQLIQQTATGATDYQVVWGAAELIGDWPTKRALFESALAMSGTNVAVALRFASAAAQQGEAVTAVTWLHVVEKRDGGNAVPWVVELRLTIGKPEKIAELKLPAPATVHYRDYAVDAARARIRTLEAMGYSPYAARRLGFAPDTPILGMTRALTEKPVEKGTKPFLLAVARAMQVEPMYLLTDLVGESFERGLMATGVDGQTDAEANQRAIALDQRRDAIKSLLTEMERNVIDVATEAEMIHYYNDALNLGEEDAMHHLGEKVTGKPLP